MTDMYKMNARGVNIDVPMTVEDLINELQKHNPKAIVKMHVTATKEENKDNRYIIIDRETSGVSGHDFEGKMDWNDDVVWIYSKGLI